MIAILASNARMFYTCVVCNRSAYCYHFGVITCNACAAFFRRTVAKNRSYLCAHRGECVTDFWQSPIFCPSCRMLKCMSVGMQESEVHSSGLPRKPRTRRNLIKQQFQQLSTSLEKFDHSSIFSSFQNNKLLRNLFLVNRMIMHQRTTILRPKQYTCKRSCIPDMNQYILNEPRFCQMFFTATGIADIAKDVVQDKISNVILYWSFITTVLNTIQYDSIQHRKLTLVDHSMIDMSEAAIRDMYATEPVFGRHLDTLVNASLPMWYRTEELIRQIRGLGMTNEEQSIFLLLGMIEIITLLSSKPLITRLRVKPLRDTVFQSMRAYYLENFSSDCTGVRFGQLIMVLPLMNEIYNLFAEHRTLINLCNGITENYTPASLLKAFHSQQVHTNCFYR